MTPVAEPSEAALHLFETDAGRHAFVPDGSRVYDLEPATYRVLAQGGAGMEEALRAFDTGGRLFVDDRPLDPPPVRSLSLNVAQTCNLACGYCYAAGGEFGGPAARMSWDVAQRALQQLFRDAAPGERIRIAFLGGEPLIARELIRKVTVSACELGAECGIEPAFAVTTNGTLLIEDDARFFENHGFAVTISLDGLGAAHDALRPFRGGAGTFERIMERAAPLLWRQRRMQVSARVTVTPANMRLAETLDGLVAAGFHSVGFSPMLSSPSGALQLGRSHFSELLRQMVACGEKFEREVVAGRRYPFSNLATALHEIHRGSHRPYPCGAGAGYLSVSASGEYFACHRFIADPRAAMGDLESGVDDRRRVIWLQERHVHRQEPCRSCWARYLCGGGCHHEAINRGRPACDFIRGWLHYCLQAYVRLADRRPSFFEA